MENRKDQSDKIVIEKALKDYYNGLSDLSKVHGNKISQLNKKVKIMEFLFITTSLLLFVCVAAAMILLVFLSSGHRIFLLIICIIGIVCGGVIPIIDPRIEKLEEKLNTECIKKLKKNIEKRYNVVFFDSHILYNGVYYVKPSYWNVYSETSVETKDIFDYVEETDEGEYKYYLSYSIAGKSYKKEIKKKQYIHLSYMREERCYLKV